MSHEIDTPPGWGDDPLTAYLSKSQSNWHASFVHEPMAKDLIQIDRCFVSTMQQIASVETDFAALFLLRTHSYFRVAASAAMACQATEVFSLARACLEYSGYVLHIGKDPSMFEKWIRRNENQESKTKMQSAFRSYKVQKSISKKDEALGKIFTSLYERTIEYGAHPNQRGLLLGLKQEDSNRSSDYQSIYLHNGTMPARLALKTVCQVGIFGLRAADHLFPQATSSSTFKDTVADLTQRY